MFRAYRILKKKKHLRNANHLSDDITVKITDSRVRRRDENLTFMRVKLVILLYCISFAMIMLATLQRSSSAP